ncbi:hypothetical protein J3L18_11135 [Mucilaginibacter gossypii]|uniref:hypothetical protein n=1 Tax=Mucilaginibacter gossypii TaxID=551996 RepID=UPI000DCBAB8F|nr:MULTISPECIES: hypothetical protein [Mucilaginibacter]QTE39580.1 hypothetical protein J3L18_11135 [Mucilaginibacter gossypii]RAV46395.1 hypothetical protein DIU36_30530 [Mucilaginibacter rubeus]
MNRELIEKYEINFTNKVMDMGKWGKKISKIPHTNSIASSFLYGWGADDLTEEVIPQIEKVLSGELAEYESGSDLVEITVYKTITIFYLDDVGRNYPEVPTTELKELVEAWRDFLLQPPFDGNAVL